MDVLHSVDDRHRATRSLDLAEQSAPPFTVRLLLNGGTHNVGMDPYAFAYPRRRAPHELAEDDAIEALTTRH